MSFYTDPVDTVVCQLTKEGRNLIARRKFGSDLLFRQVGWQVGRGGYEYLNPVKVVPIVDNPTYSVGYIEVLDNTFQAGDKVVLNGVPFTKSILWNPGATIPDTVYNIVAAIQDSSDTRVKNLVSAEVDTNPNRMKITSLVTGNILGGRTFSFLPGDVDTLNDTITIPGHGFPDFMQFELDASVSVPGGTSTGTSYYVANATEDTFQVSSTLNTPTIVDLTSPGVGTLSAIPTGNLYPINHNETGTLNFLVTPMSLAASTTLINAAYPVPPTLGEFVIPEGDIERPTDSSISFVMQIPDGAVGMNAYGELGVWVRVIHSRHPLEEGRDVLFAHGHFPIIAKSDRMVCTFRVVILF
jgi:hypothetical protein